MISRFLGGFILAALVTNAASAAGSSAAKRAGHAPQGGANQMHATEGCLNQWLFDGVWRLRVKSVEPITDGSWPGYGVTAEFRNGTHATIELGNTGVQGQGDSVQLITSDGNAMTLNDLDYQRLGYRDVVQGGQASWQLKYHFPTGADTAVKPVKFVLQIDPKQSTRAHYGMKDPSFRVDLTCGA